MSKPMKPPTGPVRPRLAPALALPLLFLLLSGCTQAGGGGGGGGSWQGAVGIAVFIGIGIALLAYLAMHLLHLEQFKGLARDEMVQVSLSALFAGLLVFSMPLLNSGAVSMTCGLIDVKNTCPAPGEPAARAMPNLLFCSSAPVDRDTGARACPGSAEASGGCATAGTAAGWAQCVNAKSQQRIEYHLRAMTEYNQVLGDRGSRSGFCNMLGVGFTVAGCSSFGLIRGPLGQLLIADGFGLMDLKAEQLLLDLSTNGLVLGVLLPLGLLLRALHFSRKAGGTLIALALSLYFVFPAALLAGQGMADAFVVRAYGDSRNPGFTDVAANDPPVPDSRGLVCDPFDPDENRLVGALNGFFAQGERISQPAMADKIIFFVIGRTMLATVLALTVTLGAVRILGQMLGAEIDVTQIARLS